LLLTALGFNVGSTGLTAIGIVLLAAGVVVMALKIMRRNPNRQL
jgi:hypothetical protein